MHSHFVATVIYRFFDEMEFLVIDYRSTDPKRDRKTLIQTKFVGGTNKECPDESVELTRNREVLEETGLILQNSKLIWKKEANPDHTKYGFISSFIECRGDLRKEPLIDDGDELSAPFWFSAKTLGRVLFHSHQELYLAALRELRIY